MARIGLPNRRVAADLLALLQDDAPCSEGMFTLIHAAERACDADYAAALLDALPGLLPSAPRWAGIVLVSALNDDATCATLVRQVGLANDFARAAVSGVCARIEAANPAFTRRTAALAAAAS